MSIRVGVNGFGRIGRNAVKAAKESNADIDFVLINDVTDPATLGHLFKYDSCFGIYPGKVEVGEDSLTIDGGRIGISAIRNPAELPWEEYGVDIVLESTGLFTKRSDAEKHLAAGAKKVLISAPATDEDITIVLGVNEKSYDPAKHHIISNASCTTNALAPIASIIHREFGIEKGLISTVHSYTNDQKLLDLPHKDLRRTRAANLSIIPTTTGAAKAVSKVLPALEGKLSGMAMRVPTAAVSLLDCVFDLINPTNAAEVNEVLKKAAKDEIPEYLGYTDEPLVSIDFKGDTRSSIVDGLSTMLLGDRMVKIVSWYDNEWAYSHRILDLLEYVTTGEMSSHK